MAKKRRAAMPFKSHIKIQVALKKKQIEKLQAELAKLEKILAITEGE